MLWSRRLSVSGKPICLGVDLSSTAVKFVELLSFDQRYVVQKFGRLTLAADVMLGTEVLNSQGLADGLRALLLVRRELNERHGVLVLCGLQPQVEEVFAMTGFSQVFEIFRTAGDALASIESREGA